MEIRYTVSPEEFAEACQQLGNSAERTRRDAYFKTWRGPVLLLFCFSVGVLAIQWRGPVLLVGPLILIAGYGLAFAYRRFVCPRVHRKSYERQKQGSPLRVIISADGIESRTEDGLREGKVLWPAIMRVAESRQSFVIFFNEVQFQILPKRAMTEEQLNELRLLLATHVPGAVPTTQSPPALS